MIYHGSAARRAEDRRHRLAAHLSGGVPDARRGGVCAQRRTVLMAGDRIVTPCDETAGRGNLPGQPRNSLIGWCLNSSFCRVPPERVPAEFHRC